MVLFAVVVIEILEKIMNSNVAFRSLNLRSQYKNVHNSLEEVLLGLR